MNRVFTVFVVLCGTAAFARADRDGDERVIGGTNTREGQYPFIVSLRRNSTNSHFCGGSIINSQWVLTAAHCVSTFKPSDIYVVAGTNLLNFNRGEVYGVSKINYNKYFDFSRTGNDTAAIKIFGYFNFNNPNISRVSLERGYVPGDKNVTAIGWGRFSVSNNSLPNIMQQLEMKTVDHYECRASVPSVSPTEICVFAQMGKGVCNGDSGGPIVLKNTTIQVGIASWVTGCAIGYPDVYTRISSYTNWIANNTDWSWS